MTSTQESYSELRSVSDGFTMVSDEVIDGLENPLSPVEFRIFVYLRKLGNKCGQSFPSYATMRERLGIGSDATIKKGLDGLVERGLIHIQNRTLPGKKERTLNLYTTFPKPRTPKSSTIDTTTLHNKVGSTVNEEQVLQKMKNRSTETVEELYPINYTQFYKEREGVATPHPSSLSQKNKQKNERDSESTRVLPRAETPSRTMTGDSLTCKPRNAQVQADRATYGEYGHVRLSAVEHDRLVKAYGTEKIKQYIGELDSYIASTGRNYKNHMVTIIRWILRNESATTNRNALSQPVQKNRFINFDQRVNDYTQIERLERGNLLRHLKTPLHATHP